MSQILAVGLAAGLFCAGQWPLSFERPEELHRLRPAGVKVFERVEAHATDGQWALRVVFPGSRRDTWPGFWLRFEGAKITPRSLLAVDVYNPSEGRQRLSWRVDDADGRRVFGSEVLPAKGTRRVEVWLGALRYQLNLARLSDVYFYVRMPREDVELYFDNFRLLASGGFAKVTHVPKQRPRTDESLVVFHRPWMEHVFSDDWPPAGERVETLRVAAARGEYEPLTISVAAGQALSGLHVALSDFEGPARLDAAAVVVSVVRGLDKRWTYNDRQRRYIAQMPVLLAPVPPGGIDAKAGEVVRFWLTVHVPKKQPPGLYTAKLVVRADASGESFKREVTVRLRVYPFELPEPEDMFYGVYYTGPTAFEPGSDAEKLRRHLEDMRAHGMTTVGVCFGWDPAQVDVRARRVDFLPPGRGRWETFMELYKRMGFPAPVLQLADTPQAAVFSHKSVDDPKAMEAYAAIWEYVQGYAKGRGWPEIIVQPVDEPAWRGDEYKRRNVMLLEALQRLAPHVKTEQDGPGDDYFHNVAGPLADMWNYNGGLGPKSVLSAAKKEGKIVCIYNCDVEWYRPEVDRYVAGWFQIIAGINGCFNWAYQSFRGDPYNDLDSKTGDHLAFYPPGHGQSGGPSVAWEGFREGVDDYRYVLLLRQLISRAERAGGRPAEVAREARAALDKAVESIRYSPRVRGEARWEKQWADGREVFIAGRLKLPNGWDFYEYDRVRRRIADWCVRLQRAVP